jgi:hypothetical protein
LGSYSDGAENDVAKGDRRLKPRIKTFTPQAVVEAISARDFDIEVDIRSYEIIDPGCFIPPDRLNFFWSTIALSISPHFGEKLSNEMWERVEIAISELYEDSVTLSAAWRELEEHASKRSIARTLSGDRSIINRRMRIANLPISSDERNYYPDRDEGELNLKRGRKPKGHGRFLFARLWLEIIEGEQADVANYRIEQHFGVGERRVQSGIKHARGGVVETFMRQLIEQCSQDSDLRDDVRSLFRSVYGELICKRCFRHTGT